MEKYKRSRQIDSLTNKAVFRTRTESNSVGGDSDERDESPFEFKLPSLETTIKNKTIRQSLETMI